MIATLIAKALLRTGATVPVGDSLANLAYRTGRDFLVEVKAASKPVVSKDPEAGKNLQTVG